MCNGMGRSDSGKLEAQYTGRKRKGKSMSKLERKKGEEEAQRSEAEGFKSEKGKGEGKAQRSEAEGFK